MFIYIVHNHTVACIREKPQQSNKSYEAHATLTFQSNQNRRESQNVYSKNIHNTGYRL